MKILFICNEFPPSIHGGIGTFVKTLTQHLLRNGHSCYVIGYDESINREVKQFEDGVSVTRLVPGYKKLPGIKFGQYDLNPGLVLDRYLLSKRAEQLISEEGIEIIESYDWSGPLLNKPKIPLIVRMHGANSVYKYYEGKHNSRILYLFEKRNLLLADHLIAVSKHIGETTVAAFKLNKVFDVVYNGIDTEFFSPKNIYREEKTILYAGTVNHRKGVDSIFKAFNTISQNLPGTKLIIVGKLPSAIEGEKIKNGLLSFVSPEYHHMISFTGHVPYEQMPEIYSKSTVAIFPSHAEAFGLTCTEAMSCETPVIMTDKASGPEIVEDGISGRLVDPDEPNEISSQALEILQNRDLQRFFGDNGRVRVKYYFNISNTCSLSISTYQSLLNSHNY